MTNLNPEASTELEVVKTITPAHNEIALAMIKRVQALLSQDFKVKSYAVNQYNYSATEILDLAVDDHTTLTLRLDRS